VGVEVDPEAIRVARTNARAAGVECRFVVGDVTTLDHDVDTVLMNPPFGAQRRHADRPFWETGFARARRAVYAFALCDSRSFIVERAVARGARIETTRRVPWNLPATFPHHRERQRFLDVDLWVIRVSEEE
ncbi:MAG: methyltransferase, partial [Thermoplasmata archaeon]